LDAATVDSLLRALPTSGVFEMVSHPGYNDADLARAHTRLLASRDQERKALGALGNHKEIKLISFSSVFTTKANG
jgi:hypothetical protein